MKKVVEANEEKLLFQLSLRDEEDQNVEVEEIDLGESKNVLNKENQFSLHVTQAKIERESNCERRCSKTLVFPSRPRTIFIRESDDKTVEFGNSDRLHGPINHVSQEYLQSG